jgi:ApaG protein
VTGMRPIRRRRTSDAGGVYEARTGDVLVRVAPSYLPEQSDPVEGRHVWAYVVEIENHGDAPLTLLSRRWIITDANNKVETVEGAGVVGEQPRLEPREAFRYASGCPLNTTSGTMRGTYQMHADDGRTFEVDIPEFSLHLPGAAKTLN